MNEPLGKSGYGCVFLIGHLMRAMVVVGIPGLRAGRAISTTSLMLADDLPAFGQAESKAAAGLAPGKEGIEGMDPFLFRKPAAVIFDFDLSGFVVAGSSADKHLSTGWQQCLATVTDQFTDHDVRTERGLYEASSRMELNWSRYNSRLLAGRQDE